MLRTSLQVMLLRIETRVSSLVSSLGKHVKWVNWSWMTLWWFTLRGIKICEFPLHSYRTTEVENRYILQYICTYISSHDFSWFLFSKKVRNQLTAQVRQRGMVFISCNLKNRKRLPVFAEKRVSSIHSPAHLSLCIQRHVKTNWKKYGGTPMPIGHLPLLRPPLFVNKS